MHPAFTASGTKALWSGSNLAVAVLQRERKRTDALRVECEGGGMEITYDRFVLALFAESLGGCLVG